MVMAYLLVGLVLAGANNGPTALLGLRSKAMRLRRQEMGFSQKPITGDSPDNIMNVLGYEVVQPTPEAAVFDGMYCRGGACQYRTAAPPPLGILPLIPINYPPSNRDFCRGMECQPGMGLPENPALNKFKFDCSHLYNDIGGMTGKDGARTIADVKQSFFNWCKLKFTPPNLGNCNGLGDVVVMAMHGRVGAANVGGPAEICSDTYLYISLVNQARVDLKLMPGAFPKPPSFLTQGIKMTKVFLPSALDSEVGPHTPRGMAWKALLEKEGRLGGGRSLYSGEFGAPAARAVFAQGAQPMPEESARDPAFKPDYTQSPSCVHGVSHGAMSYTIDNNIPPTEIDAPLYEFCANEFSEIMAGFAQTGEMVTTMTKDWCNWQSSVTSWVGESDGTGHPEWDFRRCNGMKSLVAFALHNDLDKGLTSSDVCNKMFLTLGATGWHENQVKTAWGPPPGRVIASFSLASAPDPEAEKLLQAAQEYANKLYSKLRGQKEQFNDLNSIKMDDGAFALHQLKRSKPLPPPLPTDTFPELDQ